jgi:hypothetical protein
VHPPPFSSSPAKKEESTTTWILPLVMPKSLWAAKNSSQTLNKCHGKVFEVQVSASGATRQHNNNRAAAKKLHEKLAGADFGQPWCRTVSEAIDEHSQPISML